MTEARYPSGKGEVCKTFIRGFDSHPRLHKIPNKIVCFLVKGEGSAADTPKVSLLLRVGRGGVS
jgi:hypothetical protein